MGTDADQPRHRRHGASSTIARFGRLHVMHSNAWTETDRETLRAPTEEQSGHELVDATTIRRNVCVLSD
jgi:hypothetical protein